MVTNSVPRIFTPDSRDLFAPRDPTQTANCPGTEDLSTLEREAKALFRVDCSMQDRIEQMF